MRMRQLRFLLSMVPLSLFFVQPVMAQRGSLIVHVNPREAYIYADGQPMVEARNHYVSLAPGEHKIDLYNYGYKNVYELAPLLDPTKSKLTFESTPKAK